METLDLFETKPITSIDVQPIAFITQTPIERAQNIILDLFVKRHVITLAFSGGKVRPRVHAFCLELLRSTERRAIPRHPSSSLTVKLASKTPWLRSWQCLSLKR